MGLQKEYQKAALKPSLYKRHLLSEVKNYVYEEFSKTPRIKDYAFHLKLVKGSLLVQTLEEMDPKEPWTALMQFVLSQRARALLKDQQRQTLLKHEDEIKISVAKGLHPLAAKRLVSSQAKRHQEPEFSSLSPTEKYSVYKKALAQSKLHSRDVVKRYLKKLQVRGEIPNPYKLPYVPLSLQMQLPDLPKESIIAPGSTKDVVLKHAYDEDYLDTIIKPEIEHLINTQKLQDLEQIVTKKGPYKVTVRTTNAGLMPVRFLRLPYKDLKSMKSVAMDIKYSMRAVRKSFIWNLDDKQVVPERRVGEGFSVRGSGGFSHDEVMFPRSYYSNLAHEEAWWEFLMEVEALKKKHGEKFIEDPKVHAKLEEVYRQIDNSWQSPLATATKILEDEIRQYYSKHELPKSHPIWERRAALQKEMDAKFSDTASKYGEMLEALKTHNVHQHSDLYSHKGIDSQTYSKKLEFEQGLPPKIREGIPETEKSGLSLGMLMERAGFKAYRMGQDFKKRLRLPSN